MPSEEEIRRAIKYYQEWSSNTMKTLVCLAQSVLSVGEEVEKKEVKLVIDEEFFEEVHEDTISYGNEQWNLCHSQFTLAIAKKLVGLEEVELQKILSVAMFEQEDYDNLTDEAKADVKLTIKYIAQAIRSHFEVKENEIKPKGEADE